MKKNVPILLAGLLAAAMVLGPTAGLAQDKPKTPSEGKAHGKGPEKRTTPFRGKVTAVDAAAQTVTVGERVFHLSPESKLTKGGQALKVGDIAVGDAVAGNYTKGDDGKLTAKMLRVGPKPDPASGDKPAKSKKSGGKTKPDEAQGAKEAKE